MSPVPVAGHRSPTGCGPAPTTARSSRSGGRPRRRTTRSGTTWPAPGGSRRYLPWPMSPGWEVTDFGVVGGPRPRATVTCVAGTSPLDGPVEVVVVSEEPGTGLGARCAGTLHSDPGAADRGVQPDRQDPGRAARRSRSGRSPPRTSTGPWTAASSPARPAGAGCGWCSGRPRRCCCWPTSGSSATSPTSARSCSRSRSGATRPPGDGARP